MLDRAPIIGVAYYIILEHIFVDCSSALWTSPVFDGQVEAEGSDLALSAQAIEAQTWSDARKRGGFPS